MGSVSSLLARLLFPSGAALPVGVLSPRPVRRGCKSFRVNERAAQAMDPFAPIMTSGSRLTKFHGLQGVPVLLEGSWGVVRHVDT